jgi:SAM-dependent methyltransferase
MGTDCLGLSIRLAPGLGRPWAWTERLDVTSVQEHYDQHLGPVYAWMVGGIEYAIRRGSAEIEDLEVTPSGSGVAVDLGAGFGMHAVPLARQGFSVLAIDSCVALLDELRAWKVGLPIEIVKGDLLSFRHFLRGRPELVLCMGDTLTHLADEAAVEELIRTVSAELDIDGHFVMTLRDYSIPLADNQRFIPVQGDRNRILTCFLEYSESRVIVHDILHEWTGSDWKLSVGTYEKLRISPKWLEGLLRGNGFAVEQGAGPSGMVRFVARRN